MTGRPQRLGIGFFIIFAHLSSALLEERIQEA
jgi:hypothetical protein